MTCTRSRCKSGDKSYGLGQSLNTRTPGKILVSAYESGYIGDKSGMSTLHIASQPPLTSETELAKADNKEKEAIAPDDEELEMFVNI